MKKFIDWFAAQAERGDPVGDIARDIVGDIEISGKTISDVFKIRFGGITEDLIRKDGLMEEALDEFNLRSRETTLYTITRGDPEKNHDIARYLIAIAFSHGVSKGVIPSDIKEPIKQASFDFFVLPGLRAYAFVKASAPGEPIIKAWFNIGDCDTSLLDKKKDHEVLYHCDAVVQMYGEREAFFGIGRNEEPLGWVYNQDTLENMRNWPSYYKDKIQKQEFPRGYRLLIQP